MLSRSKKSHCPQEQLATPDFTNTVHLLGTIFSSGLIHICCSSEDFVAAGQPHNTCQQMEWVHSRDGFTKRTTLLSCTSGLMVSWTMNQVALRRMKAVMRFQWMMFLRQRMLLQGEHIAGSDSGTKNGWLPTDKEEETWKHKKHSAENKHATKLAGKYYTDMSLLLGSLVLFKTFNSGCLDKQAVIL